MSVRTPTYRQVGGLHVTEWPGEGPCVLGLPGLGSSGAVWAPLAAAVGDARVIAPDLAGRGRSSHVRTPPGLGRHAEDLRAIAEDLDLRDVIVIGHSMGAFLAPVAAQRLGDRVRRLVLVDGGIPPKLPWLMRPIVVRATFTLNARRVDRAWPDVASFAAKAFGPALRNRRELTSAVIEMVEPDLDDEGRPRADRAHTVADAVDTFFGPAVVPALEALAVPAHLIAATHGKDDAAKPFLAESVVAEWTARLPNLTAERVEANHLTVMFAPEVVAAVSGG